jgi:hypothetical protein
VSDPSNISSATANGIGSTLPEGFVAVSIDAEGYTPILSLCVIVRAGGADAGLIAIRDRLDARCVLGCVSDAAQRVQKWVEIWVQDTDGLADVPPAYRDSLSNARLDERWRRWAGSVEAGELGSGVVRAGWETDHPTPILIDTAEWRAVRPVEGGNNGYWVLCEDDALLQSRGLAPYSSSLQRYLYVREAGAETFFVPVTRGAPTGERCLAPEEALGLNQKRPALNLAGGLMLVTPWSGDSLEQYLDELSGQQVVDLSQKNISGGSKRAGESDAVNAGAAGNGYLTVGRSGRLLETLHLKVRALLECATAVRAEVERSDAPLLNLATDSFSVRGAEVSGSLPRSWTARVCLREPGVGVSVSLAGGGATLHMGPGGPVTVYSPGVTGAQIAGVGSFRVRQVTVEGENVTIEGRLAMNEREVVGPGDMFWLRLNLAGQRVDLYATPDVKKAAASTEVALRTVRQAMPDKLRQQIKASEGVNLTGARFETLATAGSPHDLYALAILGVKSLLCAGRSVGVGSDDLQSFARHIAEAPDAARPLEDRVRDLITTDPDAKRWRDAVGPQHLRREAWDSMSALSVVTPELWSAVLAALVRALPGVGPESTCKDFSDAPVGAIHRVFDRLVSDLRMLAVKSRSLVVSDSGANSEIRSLLTRRLAAAKG